MEGLLQYSKDFIRSHGPTILTCIGGVGVVATSVLVAKATPKALQRLEEAEAEKGEDLTKFEVFRTTAAVYIPSVVVGASTIACIFGANVLNKRQQAALMSAYALLDSSYREYRGKLRELYGDDAHQKILDALAVEKAEDKYIRNGYLCGTCDLATDEHTSEPVLFYDEYGERYFETTIEQVLTAEYHLNRNYVLRGFAVLNELYDFLGLEPTDYGSIMGWAPTDDGMYWIEFNHRKVTLDDGLEVYILEMPFAPEIGYNDYY